MCVEGEGERERERERKREREREREGGREGGRKGEREYHNIKKHQQLHYYQNSTTSVESLPSFTLIVSLRYLQSPKKSELFCCKLMTPGCSGGLVLVCELEGEKVW